MSASEILGFEDKIKVWQQELLVQVQQEINSNQFDTLSVKSVHVEDILHRWKGSCQVLGLTALSQVLQNMEDFLAANGSFRDAKSLWQNWENEILVQENKFKLEQGNK